MWWERFCAISTLCCGKYGILLPRYFSHPSNQFFTNELYFKLIWRKKLRGMIVVIFLFLHNTVWKLRKFTLTIFGKNSVKATDSQKKLLKSWLDGIFFRWELIFRFSTLLCNCIIYCEMGTKTRSRILRKNQPFFRQINMFTWVNFTENFWTWYYFIVLFVFHKVPG